MTTTQVLQMALDALNESLDSVGAELNEVVDLYSKYPTRQGKIAFMREQYQRHEAAIAVVEAALAEPDTDADWRSATGYVTPAEYRVDRDKRLDAALAEPTQEPDVSAICWPERALLSVALGALEYHVEQTRPIERTSIAIRALKAALAAPLPEPELAEPKQEPGKWTLLLTGESAGVVGEYGETFDGGPKHYPRVNVYAAPIPEPALVQAARTVVALWDEDELRHRNIEALRKELPPEK